MTELSLHLIPLLEDQAAITWLKTPTLQSYYCLSDIANPPYWVTSSHNLSGDLPWVTKTLLSLWKFQGFRGYLPRTWEKANKTPFFLNPFTYFTHPPTPFPCVNHQSVLHIFYFICFVSLFTCSISQILHISEMQYLSFCIWRISLSVILPSPLVFSRMARLHSFLWLSNIPLYINTTS